MHACQLRVCMCVRVHVCVQLLEGSAGVQHISLFMHSCVLNDGLVFSPKRSMCVPQLASFFLSFFFFLNSCRGVTESGWGFIYSCVWWNWIFSSFVFFKMLFTVCLLLAVATRGRRRRNASQKDCFSFLMSAGNAS